MFNLTTESLQLDTLLNTGSSETHGDQAGESLDTSDFLEMETSAESSILQATLLFD